MYIVIYWLRYLTRGYSTTYLSLNLDFTSRLGFTCTRDCLEPLLCFFFLLLIIYTKLCQLETTVVPY
jgi:hypothetical protein